MNLGIWEFRDLRIPQSLNHSGAKAIPIAVQNPATRIAHRESVYRCSLRFAPETAPYPPPPGLPPHGLWRASGRGSEARGQYSRRQEAAPTTVFVNVYDYEDVDADEDVDEYEKEEEEEDHTDFRL